MGYRANMKINLIPVDTGGAPWLAIFEKFEQVLTEYSGTGGKLIHEKKPESKNLVTPSYYEMELYSVG